MCVVIVTANARYWDVEARDSEMGWGQAEDKTSFSLVSKGQEDTGRTRYRADVVWSVINLPTGNKA